MTLSVFYIERTCSNPTAAPDPRTNLSRLGYSDAPLERGVLMSTSRRRRSACVPPAETNMPILRARGQFEWLSVLRVMHGLRAAQHSMMCVRA